MTTPQSHPHAVFVTHSGRFHADEVLSCALLDYVVDGGILKIVRTRNEEDLEFFKNNDVTYVVGVGGEDDAERLCFDHHQQSCNRTYVAPSSISDDTSVPLSSCGLVYQRYGLLIVRNILQRILRKHKDTFARSTVSELNMNKMVSVVYKRCVREFDAHDNGITVSTVRQVASAVSLMSWFSRSVITQRFPTYNSLGSVVSRLNYDDTSNHKKQKKRFKKAVLLMKMAFYKHVKYILLRELNTLKYTHEICEAMEKMEQRNSHVLLLELPMTQYYSILDTLDPQLQRVWFIVMPKKNDKWVVYTRRLPGTLFKFKAPLLAYEQAFHSDDDLDMSRVDFVHKNLFMAVCTDKDMAFWWAETSVTLYRKQQRRKTLWRIGILVVAFMAVTIAAVQTNSLVYHRRKHHRESL